MKGFNLSVFDKIDKSNAFTIMLHLYAEYSSDAERLKNMALEYGIEQMAEAFQKRAAQRDLIKEKIEDWWKDINYERDNLKKYQDRICALPECNTCSNRRNCEFEPQPGEYTRIIALYGRR